VNRTGVVHFMEVASRAAPTLRSTRAKAAKGVSTKPEREAERIEQSN
jgi:hypothetical protein